MDGLTCRGFDNISKTEPEAANTNFEASSASVPFVFWAIYQGVQASGLSNMLPLTSLRDTDQRWRSNNEEPLRSLSALIVGIP